jgi:hypothetical protein
MWALAWAFLTSRFGKIGAAAFLIGCLYAVGAGASAWAISSYRAIIADAVKKASDERDAHWRAEIERVNAEAVAKAAEQARLANEAAAKARGEIDTLRASLADLEAQNAALPVGRGGGLDRARVRLLNAAGRSGAAGAANAGAR